jgi:hypothetical protein
MKTLSALLILTSSAAYAETQFATYPNVYTGPAAYETKIEIIVEQNSSEQKFAVLCKEGDRVIEGDCAVSQALTDQNYVTKKNFLSGTGEPGVEAWLTDGYSCTIKNGENLEPGVQLRGEIRAVCLGTKPLY